MWKHEIQKWVLLGTEETDAEGNIVIFVGFFGHSGDSEVWDGMDEGTLSKTKEMVDNLHKCKIDMADGIYVINVGGDIGESTKSEIEYVKEHGKTIVYLQPVKYEVERQWERWN